MNIEQAIVAIREGKRVRVAGVMAPIVFDVSNVNEIDMHAAMGQDWEVVEKKWEQKKGRWYTNGYGDVEEARYENNNFGTNRKTQEQAEAARDKMRVFNRLLAYVDEHCGGYTFKPGVENYYVFLDHSCGRWFYGSNESYKAVSNVYMPESVATKLVDDLNSGRVEL